MYKLDKEKGKKALKIVFELSSLKIAHVSSVSNFRNFFYELHEKKYYHAPSFEYLGQEAINDLNFLILEFRYRDDNITEAIKCSILYIKWILKDFKIRRFVFESYV